MPTSIYAVTHRHNIPDDHQYKACAYVEDDELRHRSRTWVIPGTRQRYCADLTAVLEGVRILAETLHTSGYVYTSNRFASSAVNDWGHRWEELSWITPDGRVRINSDIIRTIRQSISLAREDGIAIQVVRAQPNSNALDAALGLARNATSNMPREIGLAPAENDDDTDDGESIEGPPSNVDSVPTSGGLSDNEEHHDPPEQGDNGAASVEGADMLHAAVSDMTLEDRAIYPDVRDELNSIEDNIGLLADLLGRVQDQVRDLSTAVHDAASRNRTRALFDDRYVPLNNP